MWKLTRNWFWNVLSRLLNKIYSSIINCVTRKIPGWNPNIPLLLIFDVTRLKPFFTVGNPLYAGILTLKYPTWPPLWEEHFLLLCLFLPRVHVSGNWASHRLSLQYSTGNHRVIYWTCLLRLYLEKVELSRVVTTMKLLRAYMGRFPQDGKVCCFVSL